MPTNTIIVGLTGSGANTTITVNSSTLTVTPAANVTIAWSLNVSNATINGITISSPWPQAANQQPQSSNSSYWTVGDNNSPNPYTYLISVTNANGQFTLDPEIVNSSTGQVDPSIIPSPPGIKS